MKSAGGAWRAPGVAAPLPLLAPFLLVGSSFFFASVGVVVKLVSVELPNEMIVFLRSAFGLLALIPFLAPSGIAGLRTQHLGKHLMRALSGVAAMYCFFYAIARLPLAEAMLLNYSSPLFIPVIALVWLGEPLPPRIVPVVVVGFAGISLILKPAVGFFSGAALIGACSGMLTAVAMVSIRGLAREEPPERVVFYFGLVSSLVAAGPAARVWHPPTVPIWGLAVLMGVLATGGQLLLTRAYALEPAARLGPFTYSTVVFAALAGWFFWGEVPDRWSFCGALLVFLAGMLAIRVMAPRAERAPQQAIPEAAV